MKINQLDLFSGIGGFHLGFERAGYEVTSYFSEIDKHAIAVYKHKFKDSTYVGSVTDVRGADLPRIDLITFGSPCQDFSLAGKRLGMEGQRSSLVLQAIRLIRECKPSVFVWENVKGTFSSNDGADFWAIIQAFANIGGYRLEWQLLNTSWFLPQNRERIYLVGYSTTPTGDWRGVFPIREDGGTVDSAKIKQIGTRLDSGGIQPYQQDRVYATDGQAPALNAGKSDLIIKQEIGDYRSDEGWRPRKDGLSPCLATRRSSEQDITTMPPILKGSHSIRRLTPIECERLQGFPDNHTEYGNYDGEVKKMSNTQRYKQCGNAVTVDVVQAVAEQCKPLFK
jgi:DNA (cytosine-5)-methyltransferase 1